MARRQRHAFCYDFAIDAVSRYVGACIAVNVCALAAKVVR
jgi:hypothetical protein